MPAKRHSPARRFHRALVGLVLFGAIGALVLATGTARAPDAGARAAREAARLISPTGQVERPPWWHGACDGGRSGNSPGSYRLGADFDGLVACGPGPNEGGDTRIVHFFPDSWGEYEWECVELSMRWMYLAWGVPPYPADGNTVVSAYARNNPLGPRLTIVRNGTIGAVPQPGDVISMDDGDSYGHTEVVATSAVNRSGDGTIGVLTEDLNSPTNGSADLTVRHFVVKGDFGRVLDWLHNPAFSLEEPLVSEVDRAGQLKLKVGALRSRFLTAATGIAAAQVVGEGGMDPAPLLVVLTRSGELEARQDLPGARWWVLSRSGVVRFAAASEGGTPEIGWLTAHGDFLLQTRGLASTPRRVSGAVTEISIGSPAGAGVVGFVTRAHRAYLEMGTAPRVLVASDVDDLDIGGLAAKGEPVIGYTTPSGRAFVRVGRSGPFSRIGPDGGVRQLAVAVTGREHTPLYAYLTRGGRSYLQLASGKPIEQVAGGRSIDLVASGIEYGYPVLAVEQGSGWIVKEGSLTGHFVREGRAPSLGVGTLVVH